MILERAKIRIVKLHSYDYNVTIRILKDHGTGPLCIIIAEFCIIRIVNKLCISKKKTRDYIRKINISRPIDGEFHLLVQDLREMDQELLFFKYFRMNSQRFDQLLFYY